MKYVRHKKLLRRKNITGYSVKLSFIMRIQKVGVKMVPTAWGNHVLDVKKNTSAAE
jgi:hypothetical protein